MTKAIFFFLIGGYSTYDKNISINKKRFISLIKSASDYSEVGIKSSYYALTDSNLSKQEIQKLNKSEQEVLLLKFSEELSYKEISNVTGLTVSNVGFKIHHGIQQIKAVVIDELEKHLEE